MPRTPNHILARIALKALWLLTRPQHPCRLAFLQLGYRP